jgi:hypothetical protein
MYFENENFFGSNSGRRVPGVTGSSSKHGMERSPSHEIVFSKLPVDNDVYLRF